jgi:hypothetical protein
MGAADSLIGEGLAPSPYAEMRLLAEEALSLLMQSQFSIHGSWRECRDDWIRRAEERMKT